MKKIPFYLSLLLLAGCSGQDPGFQASDMPRFDGPDLSMGRSVWMGTCRNCHLLGVAGAPAVTDYPAWEPRIAKGKPALNHSALGGVKGHDDKFRMPPRGGNDRLSEEQVRRAVDYMVASVQRLNQTSH